MRIWFLEGQVFSDSRNSEVKVPKKISSLWDRRNNETAVSGMASLMYYRNNESWVPGIAGL